MNSFAGIFWLVLAQLQNRFFVEHLPVAAYVCCLKEKEWKKKNLNFNCTKSDILLWGIARFSRGNKKKLRTFQPQKWKKIKNSQPQTKFTGSYKKRSVFTVNICCFKFQINKRVLWWWSFLIHEANFKNYLVRRNTSNISIRQRICGQNLVSYA